METILTLAGTILLGALVTSFRGHLLVARRSRIASRHSLAWPSIDSVSDLGTGAPPEGAAERPIESSISISASPDRGRVFFLLPGRYVPTLPALLLGVWLLGWTLVVAFFVMALLTNLAGNGHEVPIFLLMILLVGLGGELAAAAQFRDLVTRAMGTLTVEVTPMAFVLRTHFLGTAVAKKYDVERVQGFYFYGGGLQFRYNNRRVRMASVTPNEAEWLQRELGLALWHVGAAKA